MSPACDSLFRQHLPDLGAYQAGEGALMPPLMRWLIATGRVRLRTNVVLELPWLGRRVDLGLLTGDGVASAFELKIGSLQRVLEQAAYNRSSFHRSWIVTANQPRAEGLQWANKIGVGILVVTADEAKAILAPVPNVPHPHAIRRLRGVFQRHASL